MKKRVIAACLSVLLFAGIASLVQAHTLSTVYFFEGVDLDLGKVSRDPTALLIVCGDQPDEITDFLNPALRDIYADFEPPVDFYFDYDLNAESPIVFNPVLPALDDESTYIAGMFVLWNTRYDAASQSLVKTLVFPEELISAHISINDTLVFLLNTGAYLRVGDFSLDGPSLTFKIDKPTPEPSTLLLVSLGLLTLLGMKYKKRGWKSFLLIAITSTLVVSMPYTTYAQTAKPLYRLYIGEVVGDCGSDSNCWSNHIDSLNPDEIGSNQGRLGWVVDTPLPGTKPLYQIYRPRDTDCVDIKDDHMTSDIDNELVASCPEPHITVSTLGYIYTRQVPRTIPLHRKYRKYMYNTWDVGWLEHTDHITTTDMNEGNSDGWVYERVLGYILATPPIPTLCETATGMPQIECEALTALYNNTNGANWTNKTGWLQTTTPCDWYGVTCSSEHVTELNLWQNQLNGDIPSEIGNLRHVTDLNLSHNQLTGNIPATIGNLENVLRLSLEYNQLTGNIPATIGNLANVQRLSLEYNQLSGSIPPEIRSLDKLQNLYLWRNQLSGAIPSELGDLDSIQLLHIGGNLLSGNLPPELGDLSTLRELSVQKNQLSGEIPAALGNLANLTLLRVDNNQFSGALPEELTNLSALKVFQFDNTNICEPVDDDFQDWLLGIITLTSTGVPCSICSNVAELPAAECEALESLYHYTDGGNWTGNSGWLHTNTPCSPSNGWFGVTCDSGHVTQLVLPSNQLNGTIPAKLANLSNLQTLDLDNNKLSGEIPPELGALANLQTLVLEGNQLTGNIPAELGNLTQLQILELGQNNLSGNIPAELGDLGNLQRLELNNNLLIGNVPAELGNLMNLQELNLEQNQLNGPLSADLTNLTALQTFLFQNTNLCEPSEPAFQGWLTGIPTVASSGLICAPANLCAGVSEIPQEECQALVSIYDGASGSNWLNNSNWGNTSTPCSWYGVSCAGGNVIELRLNQNQLQGALSADIAALTALETLDLRENQLYGSIPPEIGSLANLREIYLNNNQLSGHIPPELGNLTSLETLDLSSNTLIGRIPRELGDLGANLHVLRLGNNKLNGIIPIELTQLINLEELDLSQNALVGTIPEGLTNLTKLERLYLGFTGLSGSLPLNLTNLTALDAFKFSHTDLCEPPEPAFQNWLIGITELERTQQCQDYFVYEDWGGTWQDANKTWQEDSEMCWAVAAANILAWAGWGTPDYDSAQNIFEKIKEYWSNAESLPEYSEKWWLNGTHPPQDVTNASVIYEELPPGGNYWPDKEFSKYLHESWSAINKDDKWGYGEYLLKHLDNWMHSGYGVSVLTYPESGFGHTFTVWGYRYSENEKGKNYAGLWVTDSDDSLCYQLTAASLQELAEKGLPKNLLDSLGELSRNECGSKVEFWGMVSEKIGEDQAKQYQELILNSARTSDQELQQLLIRLETDGELWYLDIDGDGQSDCLAGVQVFKRNTSTPGHFAATYGGAGDDYVYSIQPTSDGGYIAGGYTVSFGAGNFDLWLLKLDSFGRIVWQKTYGGTEDERFPEIRQTSDGGYIVLGDTSSFGSDYASLWVLKLDSAGGILWQKTYSGTETIDLAHSIQQTNDGGYIVAGRTRPYPGLEDYSDVWLLKLDSNGDMSWQKTYGGAFDERVSSIQQTSDSGYIMTGETDSFGAGSYDFWILKLDSTGNVSWQNAYGGTGSDWGFSIQETADGGYVAAGRTSSFGSGDDDAWVLKLDSSGNVSWQRTYGGVSAHSIRQTSDDGYIVAGLTGIDDQMWLFKLDDLGNVIWVNTYAGSGGSGSREWGAKSIQQTPDGGYIMAGYTDGEYDIMVMKLDENGSVPGGCTLSQPSAATPTNTTATVTNTGVTPVDTTATVTDTSVIPGDTSVIPNYVCQEYILQPEMNIFAAAKGGAISPEGKVMVTTGANLTFHMVPNEGHKLARLLVDSRDVSDYEKHEDGSYSYTFENVQDNHSIEAHFSIPITVRKISLTSVYKLTEQSFQALLDEEQVPEEIVDQLRVLEDQEIIGPQRFLEAVERAIGAADADTYQEPILKHALYLDDKPDKQYGGKAIIIYNDQICDYECDQIVLNYIEGTTYLLQVQPDEYSVFIGWFRLDRETGELLPLGDSVFYAKPDDVILAVIGRDSSRAQ